MSGIIAKLNGAQVAIVIIALAVIAGLTITSVAGSVSRIFRKHEWEREGDAEETDD